MKKWLAFLLAVVILLAVHEGMHALMAMFYGEYEAFHLRPIGFEVQYRTPVEERDGSHWAYISGVSNLVTVLMGYLLLSSGEKLGRLRNVFLKGIFFYLTLISLLADPFNLSVGPFIYGGDVNGIAAGLGINRYVIQTIFLMVLLANRELVAQKLFPMYDVQPTHILFRPLIRWANRTQGAGQ